MPERNATGVLQEFLEMDSLIKAREAEIKDYRAARSNLEKLLLMKMDESKIEKLTSEGRTIYQREVLGVTMDPDKRDDLLAAVKTHGLDHLVTVQPARLKTLIQEWLVDGDDAVPSDIRDCVRLYPHRRLSVRSS